MDRNRILIGFDGSENGERAIEFGKRLATGLNAPLMLIHVIRMPFLRAGMAAERDTRAEILQSELKADSEQLLEPRKQELLDEGFKVDADVFFGSPGEVLAREAELRGAEAVVVGKIGDSKLKDVLFGSVASRLMQHCPCPLIVVP